MVLAYSMVWLVLLLLLTRVVFSFGRRIFVSSTSSCVCVCVFIQGPNTHRVGNGDTRTLRGNVRVGVGA